MGDIMRISRVSLFFFVFIYNYIFLRVTVFPYIYNAFKTAGYIILLLLMFLLCLMLLLVPKRFIHRDFYSAYHKSKVKYITNGLLFLRIVIGISMGCIVLQKLFFHSSPFPFILLGVVFVLMIISSMKPSEVIQLSTLFGIVIFVSYVLYLYQSIAADFSLLGRELEFKMSYLAPILLICLFFDNCLIFLVNKEQLEFSKYTFIFGIFVAMCFLLYEYVVLIVCVGSELFADDPLVGFYTLSIEPVSRFIGNFDYIYILIVGTACIFKFSFFLSLIKNSLKKKCGRFKNAVLYALIIGLGCVCSWLFNWNANGVYFSIVIGFMLGGILLLWMMKEELYARKIEKQ